MKKHRELEIQNMKNRNRFKKKTGINWKIIEFKKEMEGGNSKWRLNYKVPKGKQTNENLGTG